MASRTALPDLDGAAWTRGLLDFIARNSCKSPKAGEAARCRPLTPTPRCHLRRYATLQKYDRTSGSSVHLSYGKFLQIKSYAKEQSGEKHKKKNRHASVATHTSAMLLHRVATETRAPVLVAGVVATCSAARCRPTCARLRPRGLAQE